VAEDIDIDESTSAAAVAEDTDINKSASSVVRTTDSNVEKTASSVTAIEDTDVEETTSSTDSDSEQAASESLQSSSLDLDQSLVVVDLVLQLVADVVLSLDSGLVHVDFTGFVLDRVLVLVNLFVVRLALLLVNSFVLVGGGDLEFKFSNGSFVSVDACESNLDEAVQFYDLVVVLTQLRVPSENADLDASDSDGQAVDDSQIVDSEAGLSSELSSAVSQLDVEVGQSSLVSFNFSGVFSAVLSESCKSNIDVGDVGLSIRNLSVESSDQSSLERDLDPQLLDHNSESSDVDLDSVERNSEVGDEAHFVVDLRGQLANQADINVDGSQFSFQVHLEVQQDMSVMSDLSLVGVNLFLFCGDCLLVLSDLMTVSLDFPFVFVDSGGVCLDLFLDLSLRMLSLSGLGSGGRPTLPFKLSCSSSQSQTRDGQETNEGN